MNRTLIAITTIIAIAAVAVFGLRIFAQATAVNPVTADDADVNWDGRVNSGDMLGVALKYGQQSSPDGRPVREQNLDGDGNIKVAQQGTVNVNVVTAASGRIIPLFQSATWTYTSPPPPMFVDVRDCQHLDGFLQGSNPNYVTLDLKAALDISSSFSTILVAPDGRLTTTGLGVSGAYAFGGDNVRSTFVAAYLSGGSQSYPTATGSAWLYCS